MDASILQPDGSEIASKLVSLLSITTMTSLFGIKTYNVQFKYLTYSRWLVLHLYIISWAFTAAGMLFVTTNNGNYLSCLLSELFCDIFYSGTKIVIYCWLIEKVWVVSSVRQSRWRTKSYRFHVFLLTPYIAIFTLMIVFHIAELQETGFCVIGLQPIASIPLLVYDFVFNMYFTLLFVKPLMKIGQSVEVDWKSSRLHDVALRTLAASVVCLFVSFANILALVILNGRERGVVCLTCCTVDVTINVITIHWVTNNPTGKTSKDAHGSSNGIDSFSPDETAARRADPDSKTSATYRRPADIYNVGIDEYLAQTNPTMKHTYTGGTVGYYNQNGDSDQNMMGTATGAIPIGRQEQYRYLDGRFVMITEKEDDEGQDSKPSSIPESHNSRKSLTKYADNRPDSP